MQSSTDMFLPISWLTSTATVSRRLIPLVFEKHHIIRTTHTCGSVVSPTSARVPGVKLRNRLSSSSSGSLKKTDPSSATTVRGVPTKSLRVEEVPPTTLRCSLVSQETLTGAAEFPPTCAMESTQTGKMKDDKNSGRSTKEQSAADKGAQKEEQVLPPESIADMEGDQEPSSHPPYMYPTDPRIQPKNPPEPPQKRKSKQTSK